MPLFQWLDFEASASHALYGVCEAGQSVTSCDREKVTAAARDEHLPAGSGGDRTRRCPVRHRRDELPVSPAWEA